MTVKVIKNGGSGWRPFRFPPRAHAQGGQQQSHWDADPEMLQRAVAEGFQEGSERGYQQGLQQGQEAGEREGFARGQAEGLVRGREEGRREGRELFESAAAPLDEISQNLNNFLQEFERQRRQELLELVKKVSQQVIRCELTLSPTQLLNLAEEALSAMPADQQDVQVHLNPEEHARIRDLAPARAANWRLVADERLALGECRIVTAQAEVDIGCQQRLDACMDTLSNHLQVAEA